MGSSHTSVSVFPESSRRENLGNHNPYTSGDMIVCRAPVILDQVADNSDGGVIVVKIKDVAGYKWL